MYKSTLLAAVTAKLSFGGCPDYKNIANFDSERYQGQWFE